MASSSSAAAGRRATALLGARTPARLPASPRSCSAHTRTPRGSLMLIRLRGDVLVAADLPPELLGGRIITALDAASRLALFRCCHALARLVLVHAPGSKRLTHLVTSSSNGRWSATLADLFGSRWQPLPSPLGLELRITSSASNNPRLPSRLPPATVRQHTTHLHLEKCLLTAEGLAAWQLHSPTLWPHLQHLTISYTGQLAHLPTAASLRQLRPIPGLQSFSLHGYVAGGVLEAALPLAANAQRLQLAGSSFIMAPRVLPHLPHLTHAELATILDGDIDALLEHPTVEHVTVGSLNHVRQDWSQRPCRWRTLTVLERLGLGHLAKMPVAQLERLTCHGRLDAAEDESGAGLAALQWLHGEVRLALRPAGDNWARHWRLPPGQRPFHIWTTEETMVALVQLVVEAGQGPDGITCLDVGNSSLPISRWRGEVAPLLQHSGRITALCLEVWDDTPVEWCAGLLGALPPCVVSVRVDVGTWDPARWLRALVQGGVASLTHPVTLTLLHQGQVSAEVEVELRQIAAGEGAAGQPALLTLEVVRRD